MTRIEAKIDGVTMRAPARSCWAVRCCENFNTGERPKAIQQSTETIALNSRTSWFIMGFKRDSPLCRHTAS
jgi:hypothetical protein